MQATPPLGLKAGCSASAWVEADKNKKAYDRRGDMELQVGRAAGAEANRVLHLLMQPVLATLLALLLLPACMGDFNESISVDTSCREYLAFSNEERAAAVRTIGADLGWRGASNPLAGVHAVDAACGASANPHVRTIGDVIRQWVD
jgi:hypothetical protein